MTCFSVAFSHDEAGVDRTGTQVPMNFSISEQGDSATVSTVSFFLWKLKMLPLSSDSQGRSYQHFIPFSLPVSDSLQCSLLGCLYWEMGNGRSAL